MDSATEKLARRFAAAFISVMQNVSLQHAYDRYTKKGEIGPYWLKLAELAIQHYSTEPPPANGGDPAKR